MTIYDQIQLFFLLLQIYTAIFCVISKKIGKLNETTEQFCNYVVYFCPLIIVIITIYTSL